MTPGGHVPGYDALEYPIDMYPGRWYDKWLKVYGTATMGDGMQWLEKVSWRCV